MIEYYLKYNSKNLKYNITKLMLEMESVLFLENIKIEKSQELFYEELKTFITERQYVKLCDLLYTLKTNKHKNSFFDAQGPNVLALHRRHKYGAELLVIFDSVQAKFFALSTEQPEH